MLSKAIILTVVLACAFLYGAFQHRQGGWPFGQNLSGQVEKLLATTKPSDDKARNEKTAQWIDRLKKGGYLLFIRHAHRDKWAQSIAFDIHSYVNNIDDASQTSFKKAVCLSDMGVEEAKVMGKFFERIGIPIGQVMSSPSCRARQTAILAFGKHDAIENSLALTSYQDGSGKPDPILNFLRTVEIKPTHNTLLVAHGGRLDMHKGGAIVGNMPEIQETGFYIMERTADKHLSIVFTIASLNDFAIGGNYPR